MANSNAMQGAPRGVYRMKALGGGKARVWISDGTTGAAIYEAEYRAKGYEPAFDTLQPKDQYDALQDGPNA